LLSDVTRRRDKIKINVKFLSLKRL
jgi:hypothetical protein